MAKIKDIVLSKNKAFEMPNEAKQLMKKMKESQVTKMKNDQFKKPDPQL